MLGFSKGRLLHLVAADAQAPHDADGGTLDEGQESKRQNQRQGNPCRHMDPLVRVVKLLHRHSQRYNHMADQQNREVGRNIIGANVAEFCVTVRTVLDLLQVGAEQAARTATGTAPPKTPAENGAEGCPGRVRFGHFVVSSDRRYEVLWVSC